MGKMYCPEDSNLKAAYPRSKFNKERKGSLRLVKGPVHGWGQGWDPRPYTVELCPLSSS